MIVEPKKMRHDTVSTFSPSVCYEVMGPDAMIFIFLNVDFKVNFLGLLFHWYQEAL